MKFCFRRVITHSIGLLVNSIMVLSRKNSGLLFLTLLLLGAAFQYLGYADWADSKILDRQFQLLREFRPQPVSNDVVIVGIDEKTFKAFREPFALWHPHLGKFLRAMALAKPSVLGMDIVLPEHSYHFLIPQYDQTLLQGLMAARMVAPVFLAQTTDEKGQLRHIFPPYISVAGKDNVASVMVCLDNDGIARRFDSVTCPLLAQQPTLAEKMAQHVGAQGASQGLVDFSLGAPFSYVSFIDVLDLFDRQDEQQLTAIFRNKPVLLGVTLPFLDRLAMPVPLLLDEPMNSRIPGVLLHAQAFRSLISHGMVRSLPQAYLLILAACSALFWFGRNGWAKGTLITLFPVVLGGLSLWLLGKGLYFPVAGIMGIGLLAFASRLGLDTFLQIREKRFIRDAFSSYVSPQILKEIMDGRLSQSLGGTRKKVCVLFSDIRNFTSRSEGQSPEEVISLLNEYFSEMTQAIHNHDGTVDKFIGDGMMAFFGAPLSLECPERNAMNAAKEMMGRLQHVNKKLQARGIDPIQIGIGLNAGDVVIGHVGSVTRHEYTAIGDVVNTASRLEGLTKELKYAVVCSTSVAEAVHYEDGLADLGEHAVKGRSAVHVYGWNPSVS